MPVRIVKDDEPNNSGGNSQGGGGSGGGGGWLIGLIIGLLVRNPKIGIAVLVIAALVYFFGGFGGGGVSSSSEDSDAPIVKSDKGLGCQLNRKEFDKAQVFEALTLADGVALPGKVNLQGYAPTAGDQGRQGSCTAWATAYAARTIQQAVATGQRPDDIAFSPAYLYNQLTRGQCTGTSIRYALDLAQQQGLAPLSSFGYNDEDCATQPRAQVKQEAAQYRIKGYNRLTKNGDDYAADLQAIKQNLAQGAPVIVGMLVGGSFYDMQGKRMWQPTQRDYAAMQRGGGASIVNDGAESGFGGHALCIIGYDDELEGGAFQIQNSWGTQWGDKGNFWMRYSDFEKFTNSLGGEVYGLYPVAAARKKADVDFKAAVGLIDNATQQHLPVQYKAGQTFATAATLRKGTKFKIEVTNQAECYAYVFGQETNGTSYVLFPYTEKHSPYCGIVGRRVFPKDYSMQLDNEGSKDYMAVLLTKQEIDYKAINDKATRSRAATYEGKLREALGNSLALQTVKYEGGEAVRFEVPHTDKATAVLVVFEINKQ